MANSDETGVTIVMPCLNEAKCLPACIESAHDALMLIMDRFGLSGEILIADNGSSDGSQAIALKLGAKVVNVARRGYGAALIGGAAAARGRYIVIGDADGSYDFRDAVDMIGALAKGADLCMGSRFLGTIAPGAMPWKNRYIGNPVLTGILNLLFKPGISDAHCGLRALTKACFENLGLHGSGMEFASEMVIKAALKGCRIAEVPVRLSPDLRERAPHLRPWRDGWRHLRYLLMLSPYWVFAVPAVIVGVASLSVLALASLATLRGIYEQTRFGNYWVILAGALVGVSHIAGLLATATHLYGVREGYRRSNAWTLKLGRWASLETMLVAGLGFALTGLAFLFFVVGYWSTHEFAKIGNVLPAVLATSLIVVGMQNALGGFLLAVVNGNQAEFLSGVAAAPDQADVWAPASADVVPRSQAGRGTLRT